MAYVHTLFLGICNAMLQFVQQVPLDGMNCGSSCHVRLSSCISLIPVCIVNIEHRNEAGLIMRTDWEVIRQAASDRTLRVWATVPRCNVSDFVPPWNLEHGVFLNELRLLEQSLVVSGTCARELWNMSKWIVIVCRFYVPQICLEQNDFVRCLVW